MDIYKHGWTTLQEEIFSLLAVRAGEKLSQRDIAKLLGVSPTAIANSLKVLKSENMVLIEKTKTINFVSFNRDEPRAIQKKRTENLSNIYSSGMLEGLESPLAGATLILFGSYAKGEDTSTSDIDLAVIGRKERSLDLERYEKILHRRINVNFYHSLKAIHQHLRNNILNGIVLLGSVETGSYRFWTI